MSTMTKSNNGRPWRDVDATLRDYFVAEMPASWPELDLPAASPMSMPMRPVIKSRRSWFRSYGRLALAASILLMLLGYLSLAGNFPKETGNGLNPSGLEIGSKFKLPPTRESLKHGGEGVFWGDIVPGAPGRQPVIIINANPK